MSDSGTDVGEEKYLATTLTSLGLWRKIQPSANESLVKVRHNAIHTFPALAFAFAFPFGLSLGWGAPVFFLDPREVCIVKFV